MNRVYRTMGPLAAAAALGLALSATACQPLECGDHEGSVVGHFYYDINSSGTSQDLNAVDVRSDLMIAVGDAGTVITGDPAYALWQGQDSGVEVDLFGVATLDGTITVAVGAEGTVIRSEDAGLTWTEVDAGLDVELRSVAAVGTQGFVIVGDGGGAISTDAGETWAVPDGLDGISLNDVSAISSTEVFAVGDGGVFARSKDGGESWTGGGVSGFEDLDLRAVSFRGGGEGRIGTNSGRVLASENGGQTWTSDGVVSGAVNGVTLVSTETWVAADGPSVYYRHHTDPAYVERVMTTDALRYTGVRVTPYGDAVVVGENGVVLRALLDYDTIPQYCFKS